MAIITTIDAEKRTTAVNVNKHAKSVNSILVGAMSCFFSVAVLAEGGWQVKPSVKVASTYSDNIGLEPNGQSDLVLEVSPGISVNRVGRRLNVSLDYSLQNLVYLDDSDLDESNHRLSTNLNTELFTDTLFLDFNSSISQQLTSRRASGSSDAISGSGNFSDVYTYSISPYWQQRLGDIADFELRYTYDMVKSDSSTGSGDDSDSNGVSFDIENGPATGRINWNISYDNQQVSYDDGGKSDTSSTNARLGYQLTQSVNAFISGTDEDNEFSGSRGDQTPEDSTYGVGFTWSPSDDFSLTTLYNKRTDPRPDEDETFVSGDLFWAPTARTDITLGYGSRFFGDTANASINHRTRWTRWNLSYDEGVSDFRSLALQQNFIACPAGATNIAQCRILAPGEALQPGEFRLGANQGLSLINVNIVDDTFINETARASVSIVGAHNTVTLSLTDTKRTFVSDNNTEEDTSVDLSWTHQLSSRTDSRVTVGRTESQFDDGQEDDFMRYAWRITREISGNSIFYVEAQVNERDSDVLSDRYDENRLTVSFERFF